MSAQGALRPLTRALWRRPRLKLALLLSAPVGWLVVAYLGSLAVLLASAFWSTDSFTGTIVRQPTTDNFTALLRGEVYRAITLRTVGLAAAVPVGLVRAGLGLSAWSGTLVNVCWVVYDLVVLSVVVQALRYRGYRATNEGEQ